MSGVGIRAPAARAIGAGSALLLAPACFEAEGTDFFEAPSALVVTSGAAGSNDGAGGTGGTGTGSGGTSAEPEGGAGGETTAGGEVSCDAYGRGARSFGGHCYLFVGTPAAWPAAGEDCEQRGGHLVTVTSAERSEAEFFAENTFVWELGGMAPLWIAATDGKEPLESGDGTWYAWTNGEPMTYDNWSPSQPNNAATACQDDRPCSCDQGACYEHCGFLWATAGQGGSVPGWNDRACEHELPYVCEWDTP